MSVVPGLDARLRCTRVYDGSPMKPHALIIRTAGTNCDGELVHAFEMAGARTSLIHINRLIDHPQVLDQSDLIGFPGGFSYGDDISAGRIFANTLRHRLFHPLQNAVRRGVPMIGICNGFQVLVKLGLLPDPFQPTWIQSFTLADNLKGRFVDRWVQLHVNPSSRCIWTKDLYYVSTGCGSMDPHLVDVSPDKWHNNGTMLSQISKLWTSSSRLFSLWKRM